MVPGNTGKSEIAPQIISYNALKSGSFGHTESTAETLSEFVLLRLTSKVFFWVPDRERWRWLEMRIKKF